MRLTTESRADTAEHGTNTVGRHASDATDFLVGLAFQVVHANDVGFGAFEVSEQPLDFLLVGHPLFGAGGVVVSGLIGEGTQRRRRLVFEHLANDHATGDDRQVSRQAALAAKLAENRIVVVDDGEHNLGGEVFAIARRQHDRTTLSRVIDDVHDQAHEPVDEVFPRPRLVGQATLKQVAIDIG